MEVREPIKPIYQDRISAGNQIRVRLITCSTRHALPLICHLKPSGFGLLITDLDSCLMGYS